MENLHCHLGSSLGQRLAALARATEQNVNDLLKEAVRTYLDQHEEILGCRSGFKALLRSWSLEDLDLERVNGQNREPVEWD